MVSLDSSVSLPAETEVEYEPVTVTVTSPLPETTVLPFATMVTVLPSPPPEATLSAEMVVSFATTHVDVPSTFTVMGASLAVPVPEPAAVRDRRRADPCGAVQQVQVHTGNRVGGHAARGGLVDDDAVAIGSDAVLPVTVLSNVESLIRIVLRPSMPAIWLPDEVPETLFT